MSNDRQTDPPADHCPICWLDGRDTKLHNGVCAMHRMAFPAADDVGPPTRALCQIGDCIQFAVACIGGANVCNEHRDWKLRKAQASTYQTPTAAAVSMAYHASAPTGAKCADCTMDHEPCPTCYRVWWQRRHPHVEQLPAPAQVSDAARLRVAHSLLRHRDALKGGGPNITQLRHDLQTAATMLAPPAMMRVRPPTPTEAPPTAPVAPGLDPATHAHIVEALGECIANVETMDVRTFPIDVAGLLVAARAARVALGMPLPPAPPATLYQLAGFLSADIPELHGVEVPRIAESVERFIKTLS